MGTPFPPSVSCPPTGRAADGFARGDRRAHPPSDDSAAGTSSPANGRPPADRRRHSTAPGDRAARTTAGSPSADTAAPAVHCAVVVLAFEEDLVDRWMGPREGLSSLAGQVSEGSFTLSSEAIYTPTSRPLPASRPHSTGTRCVASRPAWTRETALPKRRPWAVWPPPKWTSFKPALTADSRGAPPAHAGSLIADLDAVLILGLGALQACGWRGPAIREFCTRCARRRGCE